jgi:hypothetical protein
MNLRVDLLLDTERRSSSLLSMKSVLRISALVIPLILAALATFGVMGLLISVRELRMLDARWQQMEPRTKDAAKLLSEFQANREVMKVLEGWRHARVAWHEQFAGIMRVVPAEVQLTHLSVASTIGAVSNKAPARVFAMTLQGRATGPEAELRVQEIEARLLSAAPFSSLTKKAEVTQFGSDTAPNANKDDRVFQILCTYAPRDFK